MLKLKVCDDEHLTSVTTKFRSFDYLNNNNGNHKVSVLVKIKQKNNQKYLVHIHNKPINIQRL